jgi:catechol 2,3-dioxygenase-like lactoylglutathione lyase family enzyme
MKRFHVHVSVADLAQSIRFYSTLFGMQPAVTKADYAKWMLEDPRVNFAISQRGREVGINHLGLQTDSDDELEALHSQLQQAEVAAHAEKNANCCYALSNKYWVSDPSGIAWETFHTLSGIPTFDGEEAPGASNETGCCAPSKAASDVAKIPVKSATACCG